jgi:MFS transporter, UMF1 family
MHSNDCARGKSPIITPSLPVVSWALYDLANQFFSVNVVSLYFIRWLTFDKQCPEFFYSLAFGVSTFLVAILSPLLGSYADTTHTNRALLIVTTLIAVAGTVLLGCVESPAAALVVFGIANFGCQQAVVFYNTLLKSVAAGYRIGFISGFGRMLGYSGALLALWIAKPFVITNGYHAVFIPTGILFLLFALPCMIFVKEAEPAGEECTSRKRQVFDRALLRDQFRALREMIVEKKNTSLSLFLKASFFGLCGVNVVILFMSVYVTRVFGFNERDLINVMAFATLFAIVGSLLSGYVSDRVGHLRIFHGVLISWIVLFIAAGCVRQVFFYWIIAACVGVTLGATWVVARALVVKLAPADGLGRAFGVFNLVSYLSATVGALYWGGALLIVGRMGAAGYRIALMSLAVFTAIGLTYLVKIRKVSR